MINILDVKPHVVSRDLSGYTTLLYGDPKSGKTTCATRFPKSLLLAFEKGYAALPGVMALPINTWGDYLTALRQLKDEAAKEKFSTIIIDTVDIAYDLCEQYICQVNGVSKIGDVPYGAGYSMVAKEFDNKLRSIVQENYGLVLISHAQDKMFKDELGNEYNRIVPTVPNKASTIVSRLVDIIGYSRPVTVDGETKTMLFMRGTTRYMAGTRFKHLVDHIEFNYKNLVNAIHDAIDLQMAEDGEEYFSDEAQNLHLNTVKEKDFDTVMDDFNKTVQELMAKNKEHYAPRITQIIESHLGIGKKVAECSRNQAPVIEIILSEIKDLD